MSAPSLTALAFAAGWLVSAAPALAADTVTYRLDPTQGALYAVVYNDTSATASRLGHDHTIRTKEFEGSVTWNAEDPSQCKVSISFPVTSLWPDYPGMREREGLSESGAVGEDAKKTIAGNLQSKNQLYASSFPQITFVSSACAANGDKTNVTGTISIRGVGKEVTVPMAVTADGTSFSAGGVFRVRQSDFGFDPFSNLLGALRNLDEVKVVVDVRGAR